MNVLRISLSAMALLAIVIAGCGDTTDGKTKKDDKTKTEKTSSEHKHEHKHGPNGGSHFMFDGTEEFAAEVVTYNENELVKVMFCTFKGDKTIPLKAEKVSIVRKINDKETTFDLEAIEANEDGMTDGFMLEDGDLDIAISAGPVTVNATIDGKEYSGTAHPHNH